jgi:hypothetical protein
MGFIPQQGPTSPPPSYVPQMSPYTVDLGTISGCLDQYTFIWLNNGDSFWFYLTFVGRTSILGYRFFGGRWNPYTVNLREIISFSCY